MRDGGFVMLDGIAYHDGLDLATWCDDTVRAAHDGTVLYAGRDFDPFLGYSQATEAESTIDSSRSDGRTSSPIVVVIDDGNGYRSVYVHLNVGEMSMQVRLSQQVIPSGSKVQPASPAAAICTTRLIRMDGARWQPSSHACPIIYPPWSANESTPSTSSRGATRTRRHVFVERYPHLASRSLPFDPPPPDPGGD